MSIQENNIRLENNNTNLNEIYNAINNLPTLKLQDKSVTPTMEQQTIKADESYTGLSSVKVEAIQDENLVPENIKNDVEILGVKGSFVGGKYAPRFILFRNYRGTDLDYEVANLDTSNMTDMSSMFYQCTQLKKLDLSSWNTKNVTSMIQTFYYCMNLENLDISNFDTSNVTDMNNMFNNCAKLTSVNVSSFNTSKVTRMHYMFGGCQNLISLDLSNFDTSNVTHTYNMFNGCSKLIRLDIRNFTFDKVTTYSNMFDYVPADCLIIVKSDTEKQWILTNGRSDLTNIKTVAEYEAS